MSVTHTSLPASLPVDDPDHEIMNLPKEIWQDEGSPVAQTARKYEQALRSINSALEPLPTFNRVAGYIAGAAVGSLPAIAAYSISQTLFKNAPSPVLEAAGHTLLTVGTLTGLHTAHELMMQPQIFIQEERTAKLLTAARAQARTSYAAHQEERSALENATRPPADGKEAPAKADAPKNDMLTDPRYEHRVQSAPSHMLTS
jgi:hypothetical protein